MSPKQKAFSLFAEFASRLNDGRIAKRCALIAIDEILQDDMFDMSEQFFTSRIEFWEEVKEELKKI